jgi:hypothetical protein
MLLAKQSLFILRTIPRTFLCRQNVKFLNVKPGVTKKQTLGVKEFIANLKTVWIPFIYTAKKISQQILR